MMKEMIISLSNLGSLSQILKDRGTEGQRGARWRVPSLPLPLGGRMPLPSYASQLICTSVASSAFKDAGLPSL